MITIHIVGDGPRDEATVPLLAARILGIRIDATFKAWSAFRAGPPERRLKYAARQALDAGVPRLIVTVDTDKDAFGEKLKKLRHARSQDTNCNGLVQIALGEAVPHAEAWLLDDQVAVREALHLPLGTDIPSTRNEKDPKQALEDLRRIGDRGGDPILEVLADIARRLDPVRCSRAQHTGFHSFQQELETAFRTLAADCGADCQCGNECP